MGLIQGTRSTASLNADRRKYSVSDKLWMVSPEYAVIAFFARKLGKKAVSDPEYRWFEKTQPSKYDAINYSTGYTSGATALLVDDGDKFRAGDVVKDIASSEQLKVSSVSTDTLTVVRGWGTTTAAAMADDAILVIIGNVNAEGASLRAALSTQTDKKLNYAQIFREPIDTTETEGATDVYAGGSDPVQLRKEHMDIHMKDIERSFLFGEKKEDTSGSTPVRATGGLRSFLSTNVTDASGALTETEFEGWISDVFAQGGDKKLGILSPLIGSAVNSWAKAKLQMFPKDKTYGISVTRYLSIHGQLDFAVEKLFNENTIWNGTGFAVDMDKVGYRYLSANGKNRDTKLLKNRQAPGDDKTIDEYLSEIGFFLAIENRSGVLEGVTSYS